MPGPKKNLEDWSWPAFDRYEIRDRWIFPTTGATLRLTCPFENHTQRRISGEGTALSQLVSLGSSPLPAEDEIIRWCNRNGLLGLMHYSALVLNTPAVSRPGVGNGLPTQIEYRAFGASWDFQLRHLQPFAEVSDEWSALTTDHEPIYWTDRAEWDDFHREYFPFVDSEQSTEQEFHWPSLLGLANTGSGAAWRQYAEPLNTWIAAAQYLASAILDSDVKVLNRLTARVGICSIPTEVGIRQRLESASLFGAMAAIAAQDLAGGVRPIACHAAGCGRFFLTSSYQALYCSKQCQHRQRKRNQRARLSAREK